MLRPNKTNILLQRDDVGMPRPPTRDLPEFGHAYGLAGKRDAEGVGQCKYNLLLSLSILVTTKWNPPDLSKKPQYERNFKQVNKLAL